MTNTSKAMLVAHEAMAAAMKDLPAAVVVGVVLDDGTGFVLHANSPPEDKRNLDWLFDELKQSHDARWPGEQTRIEQP